MSRWARALSTKSAACVAAAAPWRPLSVDTPQHLPPLHRAQSARQRARPRRRSCSRGGPQGQLAAAIARVGRPLSNQSVCLRVSTPADTAPLLTSETHPRSLKYNALGPKGGAAIAEGLKGNSTLQSLELAACLSNQLPCVRFCVIAPWDACSSPLTWQSLRQRRRREGCHCDCCRPQRDKDHQTQVCRRPIRSLSCQCPLTLLTHIHTPLPAACEKIDLVPVEEPLSPRASRATRF